MEDEVNRDSTEKIAEGGVFIRGIRPLQIQRRNARVVVGFVLVAVVFFLIGILIGYFVTKPPNSESCSRKDADSEPETSDFQKFHDLFKQTISTEKLESLMRDFSTQPHIAGSPRQLKLANTLATNWKSYGFDKVEKPEYNVLLSFPQPNKPNKVTIVENGTTIYEIAGQIKISPDPTSSETFDHYPYLAYAHSGTVEGDLVYVNYGSDTDYEKLSEMNIPVRGRIVIMRSRSVFNAEKHGAIGALVFPDPSFSAQQGYAQDQVYPSGWWLPSSGVQEGTILFGPYNGDPQTPVLPSIKGIHRKPVNESELPKIPAQTISYGDAMELLRRLGGSEGPESWQGGLNITYRTGPGFNGSNAKLRLEVNNKPENKSIYNVIGTIFGKEEPDRYVIVGNHRDSWSFGAVDALSGTTVTNEVARVLGTLLKKGWRPRRTIKICSWGGEEFNLIGSQEWVEENANILTERAVAYINLDIAVCGDYVLRARATPLFKQIIHKWAKEVKDPSNTKGTNTIYDIWLKRTPSDTNSNQPMIFNLFSASDYVPFYQYIGVPCGDFGYWFGYPNKTSLYPVYHTQQDTFYWMKKFVDQKFEIHGAMTQFGGGMTLDFADQPLLPFDVQNYALALNFSFHVVASSLDLSANGITLTALRDAVSGFMDASRQFEARKSDLAMLQKTSELRVMNDQMVKVEKAFIYPYGLPGRAQDRHVAFNFGFHNIRPSKATFPGITEALHMAKKKGDWDLVKQQVSIATYCVQSATKVLEPLAGQ